MPEFTNNMFVGYLILINLVTFFMYGIDKRNAVRHRWRIRVSILLGMAFAGGSAGALAGMYFFHHKTRKVLFKVGVPVMLAVQVWLLMGRI